jgi:hypothetical protein
MHMLHHILSSPRCFEWSDGGERLDATEEDKSGYLSKYLCGEINT